MGWGMRSKAETFKVFWPGLPLPLPTLAVWQSKAKQRLLWGEEGMKTGWKQRKSAINYNNLKLRYMRRAQADS